jgi:hypothetical protein
MKLVAGTPSCREFYLEAETVSRFLILTFPCRKPRPDWVYSRITLPNPIISFIAWDAYGGEGFYRFQQLRPEEPRASDQLIMAVSRVPRG